MAKTYQNSSGQYFNTQAEAAASNTAMGTNPSTSNYSATAPITSNNLNKPSSSLKLPPPTPSTYGGLDGYMESKVVSDKSASEKAYEASLKNSETSDADYLKELMGSAGIRSSVDRTAQDIAKKKYDAFTSQLEAEQLANRRAVERLDKNTQGLFGGALEQEKNRIIKDSLSKQADIAILQSAANREYSTAADIADREVQMKLESSRIRLEGLKYLADKNKDTADRDFTVALNEKIKADERAYKKEEDLANTIKDIKLEAAKNGATASVLDAIGKAKDVTEALKAAGRYTSDPLDRAIKQAQLAKLQGEGGGEQKIVKINGTDYVQNADGSFSIPKIPTGGVSELDKMQVENKLTAINSLIGGKGEASSVGSAFIARQGIPRVLTRLVTLGTVGAGAGRRANYIASIEQLTKGLTLQNLIDSKAQGATFGALSEGELNLLAESATKINSWAVKDKIGKIKYYKANESDFNKELNLIKNSIQKAYDLKYGDGAIDSYLDGEVQDALLNNGTVYMQAGYQL